jgi:surface antigen
MKQSAFNYLLVHNASAKGEFIQIKPPKYYSENCQLFVFYSLQTHSTMYGNATNWHLSGYWEEKYPPTCKFTVTF